MAKYLGVKQFWKCLGIRAVKTMAQTAAALIGTTTLITDVKWEVVLSTTIAAGLLSALNSIAAGLPEVAIQDVEDTKAGD